MSGAARPPRASPAPRQGPIIHTNDYTRRGGRAAQSLMRLLHVSRESCGETHPNSPPQTQQTTKWPPTRPSPPPRSPSSPSPRASPSRPSSPASTRRPCFTTSSRRHRERAYYVASSRRWRLASTASPRFASRADGGPSASRMVCGSSRGHIPLRDRRRVIPRRGKPRLTVRQRRGSEFAQDTNRPAVTSSQWRRAAAAREAPTNAPRH